MAAESIPPLFHGLIDDAAVFPPGNAPLEAALRGHDEYRTSWFAPLVGPLLLPASVIGTVSIAAPLRVGLVVDIGLDEVKPLLTQLNANIDVVHLEARTPDALRLQLLADLATETGLAAFGEIPLTATELIADCPPQVTPKFRTGGLSAELFPEPALLAAAMNACVRNGKQFKLTAGLHHAIRHRDRATGFWHHGFVNVLAATIEAAHGVSAATVTQCLETTESQPLTERLTALLDHPRPLWTGFGSCSVFEPLDDMIGLSLLPKPQKES